MFFIHQLWQNCDFLWSIIAKDHDFCKSFTVKDYNFHLSVVAKQCDFCQLTVAKLQDFHQWFSTKDCNFYQPIDAKDCNFHQSVMAKDCIFHLSDVAKQHDFCQFFFIGGGGRFSFMCFVIRKLWCYALYILSNDRGKKKQISSKGQEKKSFCWELGFEK